MCPCLLLVLQTYDYMEIVERVHLLNDRYAVLQEMLDILRVHAQVGGCNDIILPSHLFFTVWAHAQGVNVLALGAAPLRPRMGLSQWGREGGAYSI